jgi:hypothetical protein
VDIHGRISSGHYLKHDITEIAALQEDADAKATRVAMLYEKGIIRRDRALSQLGYDPTDPADPEMDKVFSFEAAPPPAPPPGFGGEGDGEEPGGNAPPPGKPRPKQLPAGQEEERAAAKSIFRRLGAARQRRLLPAGRVEL